MFNILATGQSNMAGRGTGGPPPLTADSRVKVWNNANELVSDGDAFISPPDFGNPPWHSGGGNNLALWFADSAARELETDVNLVVVAKGGQSISKWQADGEMYLAIKRIYQLTQLPPADVFLWHQGEADKNRDTCDYRLRLSNLIARLKGEGILAHHALTIVGELRQASAQAISDALEHLSNSRPDIRFVQSDGLADFDDIHYTGQSSYEFGLRYWDAYP